MNDRAWRPAALLALTVSLLVSSPAAEAARANALAAAPADLPAIALDRGALLPRPAIADRVTLVNFWATWCVPCRTELPSLDRLAARRPDVTIIAASVDEDRNRARRFFASHYPHLKLAFASLAQAQRFGALGMPYSVLLKRDGREAARIPRALTWDGIDGSKILARAR